MADVLIAVSRPMAFRFHPLDDISTEPEFYENDDGLLEGGIGLDYYTQLEAPFLLARWEDDFRGYIVNLSTETLVCEYLMRSKERVGPTHDYIRPMEAKEIGAATRRMMWRITAQ